MGLGTYHKFIFLVRVLSFLLVVACPHVSYGQNSSDNRLVIKIKESEGRLGKHQTDIHQLGLGLNSFKRVFPLAGKFEQRHRKHELHLWYYYDTTSFNKEDEQRIINNLKEKRWIEQVYLEPRYKTINGLTISDSLFYKQWSLNNVGQTRGRDRSDINLINALKLEKGKKDIIVSIHDSGYDSLHADIVANLWTNLEEIPENGIDDDNNGYVDDVHGYNFASNNNDLQDRNGHGTAAAGIIGSKSNSQGILGIAGGDSEGNGIQIMICRIDNDDQALSIINPEESIVYAADNGSIISQNSWNTFSRSGSVLTALNYYASVASSDRLTEGLIVFSAGNSGSVQERYEKEVDNVIMVGSTDHKDIISQYSNYGFWLDLCAPGQEIFSTSINGDYDFFSGTSFAAPHVTAVAALVLSKYGHQKYSLDSLKIRLLSTTDSIDHLNTITYQNKLGTGRLNAFRALIKKESVSPEKVSQLWVEEVLAFNAAIAFKTPYDNTLAPFYYKLELVNETSGLTSYRELSIPYPHPGDTIHWLLDSLQQLSDYSIRIQSTDYFSNTSGWSNTLIIQTADVPVAEITGPDSNLFIQRTNFSFKEVIRIENTGSSDLFWEIEERDSMYLKDYHFQFTTFGIHNDLENLISNWGGSSSKLETDFSDLKNTQFLILDDNLHNYDQAQVELIREWIINGGHAILGIDGNGIPLTNLLLEPLGLEIIPYDDPYYSYISDFPNDHHPIAKDLLYLYYYFQKGYIDTNGANQDVEVVLRDENNNPYLITTNYGKGKLIVCSNLFFGDYGLHQEDNYLLLQNATKWIARNAIVKLSSEASGRLAPSQFQEINLSFSHSLPDIYKDTIQIITNEEGGFKQYEIPINLIFMSSNEGNSKPILGEMEHKITENPTLGSFIGNIEGYDVDGDSIVYFMPANSWIEVTDNVTLTVGDSTAFNFENQSILSLPLVLFDGYDTANQHIEIVVLNINEPPVVYDTSFILDENPIIGFHIGQWLIYDPEDTVFNFQIDPEVYANPGIVLDTKGNVYVSDPAVFDFEKNRDFDIEIAVSDTSYTSLAKIRFILRDQEEVITHVLGEKSNQSITFPNPVSRLLWIKDNPNLKYPIKCSLFEISGELTRSFTIASGKEPIDLTGIKDGVYLLKFETSYSTPEIRIIKKQ